MDNNNHIDKKDDAILRNEDIMRAEEDGWQPDSPPLIVTTRAVPIIATLIILFLWFLFSKTYGESLESSLNHRIIDCRAVIVSSVYDMIRVVLGIDEFYRINQRIPNTLVECRDYIIPKSEWYKSPEERFFPLIDFNNILEADDLLKKAHSDDKDNQSFPENDIFSLPFIYTPGGKMSPELYEFFVEDKTENRELQLSLFIICELKKIRLNTKAFEIRKKYSISTLAYDAYASKLKKAIQREKWYETMQYIIPSLIVIVGFMITIKWRGKPMGISSYLRVALVGIILSLVYAPFGLSRVFYCYSASRIRLTILPYTERIHLLDSAVESGEISTESADMARKFIETLQDSGIR